MPEKNPSRPPGHSSRVARGEVTGRPFGKYTLLGELGRGGMGVVFRALDRELDREVALKMLLSGDQAGPEEVERLQREAKAAAHLRHPHIIQIYHVGVHEGRTYFTMEYVKGRTLDEIIATIDERRLMEYVRDVARALHYAHGQGIIHRDVKPSNILIANEGKAYLMDFGLAKQVRDARNLTATGFVMGTPNYMSPEQVNGLHHLIDGRSDVFSLGSVLFTMLTGRCPFERDSVLQTVIAVVQNQPEMPRKLKSTISKDVETICLKAMEKDSARRYQSGEEMAADIDRYLRGEPVMARPLGSVTRAVRWSRRNSLKTSFVAVSALALVGGGWFWTIYRAQRAEAERIARAADDDRRRREEIAARRERAEEHVKAAREQAAIADRCRMTGLAPELKKSLLEAIKQCDAALAVDDGLADAWAERGRARSTLGEKQRALDERGQIHVARVIDRMTAAALEPHGPTPGANARAARASLGAASEDLGRAADLDPGPGRDWVTAHARGALAFLAGNLTAARADLDRALNRNPFLDDALVLHAYLFMKGEPPDWAGARADLDRAVQANAFNVDALHRRGIVRFETGDVRGSLQDYDRALEIDPTLWRARINRGRARIAAGEPGGALADLGAVLAAEPDNLLALADRAEARLAARDWGGAEGDLTRALELAPQSPLLLTRRSIARLASGDAKGALADAGAAAAVAEAPAQRCAALLEHARAHAELKNAAGAIADYGEVLALDEGVAEAWLERGRLRLEGGQAAEAAEDFRKFLGRFPEHARAAEVRAALERIGGK
ncbi:MAG: protein kinase [Planctomycetes bacterium]|nr:protein kinase [Planctomycetota bacterium]